MWTVFHSMLTHLKINVNCLEFLVSSETVANSCWKFLQCYNKRKLKTRIIFVNLTALEVLLISAYDVDYTHHRIIQEPKLSLCHIQCDHIFRMEKKKIKMFIPRKDAALYSNLQLDLSRSLFPYALPSKILQNLATFPWMQHVTKI